MIDSEGGERKRVRKRGRERECKRERKRKKGERKREKVREGERKLIILHLGLPKRSPIKIF